MNATTTNNSTSEETVYHPRIPTSTLGPATITIIVALVLVTCCILHCHRVQYTVRSRRWVKHSSTTVTHDTPLPLSNNNPRFTLQTSQHGEQWDEKYQQDIQQPQPVIIKSPG